MGSKAGGRSPGEAALGQVSGAVAVGQSGKELKDLQEGHLGCCDVGLLCSAMSSEEDLMALGRESGSPA